MIRNGPFRGILLNSEGINANPGTRRVTLAHELCHAIWEEDQDLDGIRLEWGDARRPSEDARDLSEDLAQAFAGELLAPAAVASRAYLAGGRTAEALHGVMRTFGVSLTCARIQIWLGARGDVDGRELRSIGPVDLSEWAEAELPEGDESLPGLALQRSGRFLDVCREAYDADLIEIETMSDLLRVGVPEVQEAQDLQRSMRPYDR